MSQKLVPNYVLASIFVSLGGFLNGYDTGAIGAIVSMSQFKATVGFMSPTLVGFTVSLIMLAGAVPSVFAGYLADRFGRIKVIGAGTVLFAIGAALQGTSFSLAMFNTGRALSGLGEGVYLSSMSVYICEIAPSKYRGILAGLPQFLATMGVCVGYFTCYGTVQVASSIAWRVPYIVEVTLAVLLIVGCLALPDSPRWLMLHGKRAEALAAMDKLDFSLGEAEQGFLTSNEQGLSLSAWQSIRLLFSRGYRARTVLALFILGMVQLSGIDGVLYYAPQLFSQAGLDSEVAAFLASGLSAILMLAVSIPAFLLADKWGRRTSAITGGIGLAGCMLLMGTLYAAGVVHPYGIARWVVIVLVFVFGMTYCATWGIVGKIYASEIQPSNTRSAANCVAQGLGFFTNWLVAILTPILLDKSAYGAYFLFGGLALGTVSVLAACMPETRGRSLEDISEAFHRPGIKSLTGLVRRKAKQSNHSAGQSLEMESPRPARLGESASGQAMVSGLRIDMNATQ